MAISPIIKILMPLACVLIIIVAFRRSLLRVLKMFGLECYYKINIQSKIFGLHRNVFLKASLSVLSVV
jgi:hypothetical protein